MFLWQELPPVLCRSWTRIATAIWVLLQFSGLSWAGSGNSSGLPVQFSFGRLDLSTEENREQLEQTQLIFEDALVQVSKACDRMSLKCNGFSPLIVVFSRSPIVDENNNHFSAYIESEGKRVSIFLKKASVKTQKQLRWSLFHELMHWIHYNVQLQTDGGIWTQREEFKNYKWFSESWPVLAGLIYGPPSDGITGAERAFLEKRLSGDLSRFSADTDSYGLVGLWTRYLYAHVKDPERLLKDWLGISPRRGPLMGQFDFTAYGPNGLPGGICRFQNLYHYFAMALNLNTTTLESWGLYSLGLPEHSAPVVYQPGRVLRLRAQGCTTLAPFGFFYASPEILNEKSMFTQSGALRIILFRGRYRPVILSEERNWNYSDIPDWYRILVFNPTEELQELCID